jgi:hypothetical protein
MDAGWLDIVLQFLDVSVYGVVAGVENETPGAWLRPGSSCGSFR